MTNADDYKLRVKRVFEARAAGDADYLIDALRDPDVRSIAAKWLAELGEMSAVEPLILLLAAREPSARSSAADALGKLRAVAAIPNLIVVAERDEVRAVREWAIGALSEMEDPRGTAAVMRLLADPDPQLRGWVATVLGRRGETEALQSLRSRSRAEPLTRRWPYWRAIRAIERANRRAPR